MAGEVLEDFEKKKNFFFYVRQRLGWLLPISNTRSRPSFEVVTGRHHVHRAEADAHVVARITAPA